MGTFNNYGKYDAEAEKTRLAELVASLRPETEPGMQEPSGRVSCKKQNMQEVPSEKIQPKSLLEMDYSELELRVIATMPKAILENNGGRSEEHTSELQSR